MALTTKLDAVNVCLAVIGEMPVTSTSVILPEVNLALRYIDRVTREILSRGWNFNTDIDFEITPDVNSKIAVPADALSIDVTQDNNLVQRGMFLYDKQKHTAVITKPVKCIIIRNLDYEDLPEPFKHYIYIRAARQLQRYHLGSAGLDAFAVEDEMNALLALSGYEADTGNYNILNDSPETWNANNWQQTLE